MRRKTLATMAKHSFAEHNLLVEAKSLDESGKTNMNAIQILMVDHEEAITMIDALLAGQLVGAAAAEAGEMKARRQRLVKPRLSVIELLRRELEVMHLADLVAATAQPRQVVADRQQAEGCRAHPAHQPQQGQAPPGPVVPPAAELSVEHTATTTGVTFGDPGLGVAATFGDAFYPTAPRR